MMEDGTLEASRQSFKFCFLSINKFKGKNITFLEESGVIPPRNTARKRLHSPKGNNKRKSSLQQELELILSRMPQCLRYET